MPPHRPSILLSRLKALVMPSTQKSVRARLSQPGTGKWTWTPLIKSISAAATWTSNFIDTCRGQDQRAVVRAVYGQPCGLPGALFFRRLHPGPGRVDCASPQLLGRLRASPGALHQAAYGVVFLAIVTFLRPEQVERLLSTALVSVYPCRSTVLSSISADPAPWSGDVTQRVASTMGNPIFVAAFLSLIVPLTLYRHLKAGRRISSGESRGMQAILSMGSLLYLLFQVVAWCIGPTTGTLAALTSFGVWILEAVLLGKPVLPFIRIGSYSGRLIASSLLVGLIMMTMAYGFLSFHIRPANLPSVV